MLVNKYTREFYKLNIRVGHREEDPKKVVRYINGLSMKFEMRSVSCPQ